MYILKRFSDSYNLTKQQIPKLCYLIFHKVHSLVKVLLFGGHCHRQIYRSLNSSIRIRIMQKWVCCMQFEVWHRYHYITMSENKLLFSLKKHLVKSINGRFQNKTTSQLLSCFENMTSSSYFCCMYLDVSCIRRRYAFLGKTMQCHFR